MAAQEHTYRYAEASRLVDTDGTPSLRLSGDSNSEGERCYFRGSLLEPLSAAQALRTLSLVVGSRFYTPPAMRERLLRESDPVVTAGRRMLRFEGFSSCCSAYARLDLDPEAFESEDHSPGTTNVDFGSAMLGALAQVRAATPLQLVVRAEGVELQADGQSTLEKKVPLPMRWLRGLGEVQAQLARMDERHRISSREALRFLRSLPRSPTRDEVWVVAAGAGLRQARRPAGNSVALSASDRLRPLEGLVSLASELRVFTDPASSASAWMLDLGSSRFTYALSPTRWRGFSGEGQLLRSLARDSAGDLLARVRASLSWQDQLDPEALAAEIGEDRETVEDALALLAARGLVGYDLAAGCYFHRLLPFDLSLVEGLHPRLQDARKLFDAGCVTWTERAGLRVAVVRSGGVDHRVRFEEKAVVCSCPWHAKHGGDRVPCKHQLAAEMACEGSLE